MGRYCQCTNHIRGENYTLGGHIGVCEGCCYAKTIADSNNNIAKALQENAKHDCTAQIIAELERLLKNIKDYESDTEGGDETWFEYIDPQVIEDRIKYYKAKETQL